jgi:hypothetical protein
VCARRDDPRGWGLARDLKRIERKRALTAAIDKRLQGLTGIDRRRELERLAADAEATRARLAAR